jgi:signal transduction histidine kinase
VLHLSESTGGELIHRNPADLIGKNVWEVFPDAVGSTTYEAFNKAMRELHYVYNVDYYKPLDLWQENHIYPSSEGLSVFIRDITEKKKLEIKLQEQQRKEQLKVTAAWLEAQEKERNTIAQELHDNVNQILAGTNLYLSIAKINPEKTREHIESSMINIQSAIAENRKIAHVLVTPDFESIKLTDLIQNLLDNMLSPSGIDAHIDTADLKEDCLNDEQRLAIYRITQEQCTNIIKYAKAQHVIIIISTTNGIFEMSIADNGNGMELNKVTAGIGLRNIKSRAVILNGETNVITSPGNGFTLEIRMPYET